MKDNEKIHRMFNVAERPVMELICNILDETPDIVFKDPITDITESLVISLDKKDVCIKLTLTTVKNSDVTDSTLLNSIIDIQLVKESIGFLWYCVREVFSATVLASMINKKTMGNIVIDLNESNWKLFPRYLNDLSFKVRILEDMGKKIATISPEKTNELHNIYTEICELKNKITPEMLNNDNAVSASFNSSIYILAEEIRVDDLPKHSEPHSEPYDIESNVEKLFN